MGFNRKYSRNADQENEFCTVKLLLEEKSTAKQAGISFRQRVTVALAWTINYYAALLAILCAGTLLTLLLVVLLQRLNLIPPPIRDKKGRFLKRAAIRAKHHSTLNLARKPFGR